MFLLKSIRFTLEMYLQYAVKIKNNSNNMITDLLLQKLMVDYKEIKTFMAFNQS